MNTVEIREVRKTKAKKKTQQIRACDREVSSVFIWMEVRKNSPFPKAEHTKRSKFLLKNFRYFLEPPAACYGNISIAWNKKKGKK